MSCTKTRSEKIKNIGYIKKLKKNVDSIKYMSIFKNKKNFWKTRSTECLETVKYNF